jgi:glutamine amidotransferase
MSDYDVVVVDYGIGNLLSVKRGLEYCGANVLVTSDPEKILHAKKVILPGVGAYSNAMNALMQLNLVGVIKRISNQNTPLLGICLGMQLLMDGSDEFGYTAGLGIIPGVVVKIPANNQLGQRQKIPHIGWNTLVPANKIVEWEDTLLAGSKLEDAFYFVHSYMAMPLDISHRIADCMYGSNTIASVIGRNKVTGCQFHPEKSGEAGLNILRKFLVQ